MTIGTPPILIVTGAEVEEKTLSVALGVKDDGSVFLCCILLGSMFILERLLVVLLVSATSDLDVSLKVYPNLHFSGSLQRFLACSTLK